MTDQSKHWRLRIPRCRAAILFGVLAFLTPTITLSAQSTVSDQGHADVTDAMGRQAPKGLLGIHLDLFAGALGIADQLPAKSEQECAAHKAVATELATYVVENGKPLLEIREVKLLTVPVTRRRPI